MSEEKTAVQTITDPIKKVGGTVGEVLHKAVDATIVSEKYRKRVFLMRQ